MRIADLLASKGRVVTVPPEPPSARCWRSSPSATSAPRSSSRTTGSPASSPSATSCGTCTTAVPPARRPGLRDHDDRRRDLPTADDLQTLSRTMTERRIRHVPVSTTRGSWPASSASVTWSRAASTSSRSTASSSRPTSTAEPSSRRPRRLGRCGHAADLGGERRGRAPPARRRAARTRRHGGPVRRREGPARPDPGDRRGVEELVRALGQEQLGDPRRGGAERRAAPAVVHDQARRRVRGEQVGLGDERFDTDGAGTTVEVGQSRPTRSQPARPGRDGTARPPRRAASPIAVPSVR